MYLIPKLEAQFRRGLLRPDMMPDEVVRLKECLEISKYFDFEDEASALVITTGLKPIREWLWMPAEGDHWPILMVEMKLPIDDDVTEYRRVVISTWTGHLIISFEAPNDRSKLWHFPIGCVLDDDARHGEWTLDAGEKVDPYALLKDKQSPENRAMLTAGLVTLQSMITNLAWGLQDDHTLRIAGEAPFEWHDTVKADRGLDPTKAPFKTMMTDAAALHGALIDPNNLKTLPSLIPRLAMCAISLIMADREVITRHPQPRRPTLKGATKGSPRLYVPEHYTVTHSLLKKVVYEKIDTGVQRKDRERRRKKRHKVEEHDRTLKSGRVIKVTAHERGDKDLGWAPRRIVRVTPPPGETQ